MFFRPGKGEMSASRRSLWQLYASTRNTNQTALALVTSLTRPAGALQNSALLGVRGKGITSRIFGTPVTN